MRGLRLLPSGDGIAGIRQHLGDLQPETLRPDLGLLPPDHDGHLDDNAEAEFRGFEHGDGGALRGTIFIRLNKSSLSEIRTLIMLTLQPRSS